MPTIGIDCRFAAGQYGLGRYTREIVTHMVPLNNDVSWVLFVQSEEEDWLKALTPFAKIVVADVPHYSVAEQRKLPRIIRNSEIDILFVPHFNVPLCCPVPFVVTIHDLILHRYANNASFAKKVAYKLLMRHAVKKAQHIIAVSNFTKQELVSVYGESIAPKSSSIHEGISSDFSPKSPEDQKEVQDRYRLPQNYFLYVGNAKEHKNVQLLIDAYEKAGITDADLILVTSGKEITNLGLPAGVHILSSVSDKDLPALYSGARAFVTASLYEGYCFPVLEAAACNCPVIATNGSAIAEVAPANSMLLPPDKKAFSQAFLHPPSKSTLCAVSPSWEKAAHETLAVLRTALPLS
jgi:glycosyltransferase involved in cell wall biosynthesis